MVMRAAEADTLGEVLERIAEASRELVGAKYAALGVPDGRGGLEFFEFSGMDREHVPIIGHLPLGRGLIGAVMRERQPIRVEHMQSDPRSSGFPANHPNMERFLGVPVMAGNVLYGQLYLADRLDGKPFNEQDQWLIETLAGYAALAIAGANLREQQRRVALLEERDRISMELHDGVIQSLYAIGMHMELLRLSEKPVEATELQGMVGSLNDVIEDIRSYIQNLKLRERYGRNLREFIYDITRKLHIPRTVNIEIDTPSENLATLSPQIYEAMCQMANEGISNVIRHASASHLKISASQTDRAFQLKIADDGVGFDPDDVEAHSGLGLRNIQHRARMHGGDVYIDTAPGQGTCLTISLPLNAKKPVVRPA
ncbi:MAG: GAF domain-containing sensor histidine kinase [Anaerolineae bacterium]|nr:GAF domain-containing sensor histidine kinase [Anaerolineae bacterium]